MVQRAIAKSARSDKHAGSIGFPGIKKSAAENKHSRICTRKSENGCNPGKYHQAKDKAVFDTAKHLKSINGKVQSIDDGLSKERAEREKADEANKRYTQMWNKINLAIGIIGVILAAFALFKP